MSKTFVAISTLIGTIIGAGILGIPFVVMLSGFSLGILNLTLLTITIIILMLYLGEIALRTKTNHHLTGYAEKYLGKKGKHLMFIAFSFGVFAAILAYLIGEGESLSYLFFQTAQYKLHFGIAFWLFLTALTYFGLQALKGGEEIGLIIIFVLIISISVLTINKIDITNLSYNNFKHLFTPFGVILFALLGFSTIPEVKRILGKDKNLMKRSIVITYILCFFIYALFAALVLGFKGPETPQIATLAIGKPFILLGMITMFTSYLALTIALIDTLKFDLKISKNKAWLYANSIPLILFIILSIFDIAQFTKVLGIGGAISGGLTAILILFIIKKAKEQGDRKPEYSIPYSKTLTWILIALFSTGTILEIINAF